MYTKQRVNHTIQYSVSHISHPTPPIPFPSLHLADLHPTSPITFQPLFLEILNFLCTSKSLHFTSLNTFLTFLLYIFDFPALQNPVTLLRLPHFSPFSWKYAVSSSLRIPFTHHFPNPLSKGAQFEGESP
jgi:hypothetical protein